MENLIGLIKNGETSAAKDAVMAELTQRSQNLTAGYEKAYMKSVFEGEGKPPIGADKEDGDKDKSEPEEGKGDGEDKGKKPAKDPEGGDKPAPAKTKDDDKEGDE